MPDEEMWGLIAQPLKAPWYDATADERDPLTCVDEWLHQWIEPEALVASLAAAAAASGVTAAQLAVAVRLREVSVVGILRGQLQPPRAVLVRLQRALGLGCVPPSQAHQRAVDRGGPL